MPMSLEVTQWGFDDPRIYVQLTYLAGISPRILCIIARCSLLSCVWKRVIPKYNSNNIQPIDHTSQGWDQPNSENKKTLLPYVVYQRKSWEIRKKKQYENDENIAINGIDFINQIRQQITNW